MQEIYAKEGVSTHSSHFIEGEREAFARENFALCILD